MARRRKSSTARSGLRIGMPRISFAWLSRINWHVVRQSAKVLAWLLAIALVIGGWAVYVPQLQAFAAVHNSAKTVNIRFTTQPRWMTREIAESLLRTAHMQLNGGDPFNRNELVAVRDALMATGWFDSIQQVRRLQEDLIEINATYVRPYALVLDEQGHHLIDQRGKLLPFTCKPGSPLPTCAHPLTGAHLPLLVIANTRFARPIRPGLTWEGEDVAAALKLIDLVGAQPWRDQITQVDVAGYTRDQPMKLRTTGDCLVVWGSAPGAERGLELSASGKIDRLSILNNRYHRIDGCHKGELDITDPQLVAAR
jgi:hypothetical protein